MRIRDALESDAAALAELTGRPRDVVRNLVHERSVRVAVGGSEPVGTNGNEPETRSIDDGESGDDLVGFVAFDVRSGTVHITDFDGKASAVRRLLEEPRRFAKREGMNVEAIVPDGERDRIKAVEDAGFEAVGRGPRFDGRETTRFRLEIGD
ncbi:MAG: hypothetical protein PPP55_09515 [Halorubrum sp.]